MTFSLATARKATWTEAGIPTGIPTVTTVGANVKTWGAVGNGTTDDTTAFERAISNTAWSASSPKLLYVPAGTYKLTRTITIPSGCVVSGDGSESTTLSHNLNGAWDTNNFQLEGAGYGTGYSLSSGYTKGSSAIVCSNASQFTAGNIIELYEENDPSIMYTKAEWNVSWAQQMPSEQNIVSSVVGTTINLTYPLIRTFRAAFSPRVRKVTCTTSAGFQYVKVHRVDDYVLPDPDFKPSEWNALIYARAVHRCWVYRCELSYACHKSLLWNRCSQCEVRANYIHHAHRYRGNQGDGISFCERATRNLVVDNILFHLNALFLDKGAIGNVYFANHNYEPWDTRGGGEAVDDNDYSFDFHGHYATFNLMEHNTMGNSSNAGYWGPCPNNTWFRNRIWNRRIQEKDPCDNTNYIANELTNPGETIRVYSTSTGTLLHGNMYAGQINWASGEDQTLPASFYAASKPSWWGDEKWPAIGPDVVHGITPAERRWITGAYVEQP
jgi:hypothetical protein